MFSLLEMQGQSSLLHKSGSVELNTQYCTRKKPIWLVALKLLGVAAMVAVGGAIAMPTLLQCKFPLWQAIAITLGAMAVYTGIAFFVRPEPNTDNLGMAGGMVNDPFQFSDNINRFLWKAHCCLGPGRFTAETLLDLCALIGLAGGEEVIDSQTPAAAASLGAFVAAPSADSFDATRPIAPLDPNRFAQSSAHFVTGQIQLDTQRFMSSQQPATPAGR
jgi:hypothetical protein